MVTETNSFFWHGHSDLQFFLTWLLRPKIFCFDMVSQTYNFLFWHDHSDLQTSFLTLSQRPTKIFGNIFWSLRPTNIFWSLSTTYFFFDMVIFLTRRFIPTFYILVWHVQAKSTISDGKANYVKLVFPNILFPTMFPLSREKWSREKWLTRKMYAKIHKIIG